MPASLTAISAEFVIRPLYRMRSEATELGDRTEADDGHGCQGSADTQALKNAMPMQCPDLRGIMGVQYTV